MRVNKYNIYHCYLYYINKIISKNLIDSELIHNSLNQFINGINRLSKLEYLRAFVNQDLSLDHLHYHLRFRKIIVIIYLIHKDIRIHYVFTVEWFKTTFDINS